MRTKKKHTKIALRVDFFLRHTYFYMAVYFCMNSFFFAFFTMNGDTVVVPAADDEAVDAASAAARLESVVWSVACKGVTRQ